MQIENKVARKPEWLKIRPPAGENYTHLKSLMRGLRLHTVCEEASCPNVAECWGGGTLTVMVLGDTCTRGCKFCHVKTGNPRGVVDRDEPENTAKAIANLKLTYVVITSVDRDDLPDGGADHFGKTVEAIRSRCPETKIEVLIPDFRGDTAAIERLCQSKPDVIAQNLETVKRLTRRVRDPRCGYEQTLGVLKRVKETHPTIYTKSSLMLGLGETREEISQAMDDLREAGVQILTLGQYLRPTMKHLPVEEYLHPSVFEEYRKLALTKNFLYVASGPMVRSSYKAGELFMEGLLRKDGGH